ncbi:hypothetical protein D0869_00247 [Hortaea werneckii]|uniref:Uncharacterized protein n=2 Tax=Hortaea werneckii TaxID=91943 RepID=A0A3M6XI99_HORWE|nr:hypothetical protein KC334_g891 [Hortaea werneckii]KAI7018416.1 hypothetical protein KC355_g3374 [Hortaea werneckii]KAI7184184.1 hypothetical protein KC324_g7777 [Hortaea werneckii]KAI7585292.1 hypothetical protein KC316_g6257 [Hortaea werneckii]KAI7675131.1 hypothetical protein KC318_g1146 [Hortaea werneckii]
MYDTFPQLPETIDPALLSFNTPYQAPQYPSPVFCSTCGQQHPDQASLASHGHWVHMVEASLDCASTGCEFCSFVAMDSEVDSAAFQSNELQQQAGAEGFSRLSQTHEALDEQWQDHGDPFIPYGFAGDPSAQTSDGTFAGQQMQFDANAVWSPSSSMNYYDAPIVPSIEQPSGPPQPSQTPSTPHRKPKPSTPVQSWLAYTDGHTETRLPRFMSQIEIGTFDAQTNTWTHPPRRKPGLLLDPTTSQPIYSTINPTSILNTIPFLPTEFHSTTPLWLINLWLRRSAEEGLYIGIGDLTDRCIWAKDAKAGSSSNAERRTTMSVRVQRYNMAIGQLPVVEKRHKGLPAQQAMATVEGLTVLQGELNTCWQPNQMTRKGPWVVCQPVNHVVYEGGGPGVAGGRVAGNEVVIETLYGLSERMKRISDGMIFLDGLAEEAGLQPDAAGRSAVRKRIEGDKSWDLDKEFEIWTAGGRYPDLTVEHTECALENAKSEEEVLAVLWGHLPTIRTLKRATKPSSPTVWEQMSPQRVALLLTITHGEFEFMTEGAIEAIDAALAANPQPGFALQQTLGHQLDQALKQGFGGPSKQGSGFFDGSTDVDVEMMDMDG